MKQTDRVRAATYACNQRARQFSRRRQNLFARFPSNYALKLAHHERIRMRTQSTAEQIIGVMDVRYPIAQCLVDCILQGARAGIHSDHFCAEQLHSEDVECLPSHVFGAHVNDTTQPEQRANRRRCDTVLACTCLSDDATLAHSTRKQRLSHSIVDLVRAGVQKVFTLQIDLRASGVSCQPLRVKQRCWPATVIAQQLIEFAPEIWVFFRAQELGSQFVKRRNQCFRNVATAKLAPMAVLVWLAFCNRRFLHRNLRVGRTGSSYSGNEIFESPVIFYSRCALNAATNVNSVRRYRCNGLADILFG